MTLPPTAEAARLLDEALADFDWSIAPEGVTTFPFEAPSGTLAAWAVGDPSDPRVVLVPGATGSKEDFALLAPILAGAGYYVQSYDLAGQYESWQAGPSRTTGEWDYDMFVGDMVAFLEAGEPAHLLGFSFAGILAQIVTVRHPRLVRSLTLLATPPLSGQVFRGVRFIGWVSRLPFCTAHAIGGALIWNVETNFSKVTPMRLLFARSRLGHTRRESVDGIVALMRQAPDLRAQLSVLGVPRLVASGSGDLWSQKLYRRFARRIGARSTVYRTGHSPCETTPYQLAYDMVQLFQTADGASGSSAIAPVTAVDGEGAALA